MTFKQYISVIFCSFFPVISFASDDDNLDDILPMCVLGQTCEEVIVEVEEDSRDGEDFIEEEIIEETIEITLYDPRTGEIINFPPHHL